MSNFLPGGVIRTWGRALSGGISKNIKIEFFESQMHFLVSRTGSREISTIIRKIDIVFPLICTGGTHLIFKN